MNMSRFNKDERKAIVTTFEDEDAQKMTEEMIDKALG